MKAPTLSAFGYLARDAATVLCCFRCWRTRRLLKRKGYRFEILDVTDAAVLRSWPAHFVAHRPVGGLREIRALESSGELDRLVRGEV